MFCAVAFVCPRRSYSNNSDCHDATALALGGQPDWATAVLAEADQNEGQSVKSVTDWPRCDCYCWEKTLHRQ